MSGQAYVREMNILLSLTLNNMEQYPQREIWHLSGTAYTSPTYLHTHIHTHMSRQAQMNILSLTLNNMEQYTQHGYLAPTRMGLTIREIQKGGAMNVPETLRPQGFARTLAVCYNMRTGSLTCGMSGKLRKVRVHPLIWGKSVEVCLMHKLLNPSSEMVKLLGPSLEWVNSCVAPQTWIAPLSLLRAHSHLCIPSRFLHSKHYSKAT